MASIYQGDKGVQITLNLGIDLSTSTVRKFKVKLPDNTEVSWPSVGDLSIVDTTKLTYTTVGTDLATAGTYTIQPYVEFGASSVHSAAVYRLVVKALYT